MAKDRTVNPATAALKAAKKKDIKKGKASVEKQRAERFAKRNPFRIQQQIDELKQAEENGGLKAKDKHVLEQLQREHKAILRAREQLGDKAPQFRAPRPDGEEGNVLGKRRRGEDNAKSDSETDEDVKAIPMPKDVENMPPAPKRKPRHTNTTDGIDVDLSLPQKPAIKSQVVYESAPAIKDLRKEATKAFIPSSVARNIKQAKGDHGRLIEPEELDRLEQAGYKDAQGAVDEAVKEAEYEMMAREEQGPCADPDVHLRRAGAAFGEATEDLERDAMRDARTAADEAKKEAEYELMRQELEADHAWDASTEDIFAEKQLRKVEIEEVGDEEA